MRAIRETSSSGQSHRRLSQSVDRALKKEFPAVVRLAVFIFVRAIVVVGVQGGAVREAGSEKCAILSP